MKNLVYFALFLGVIVVALTVFDLDTALLGQDILSSSDLPWSSVPDVDANSAANTAKDGADAAADQVESWSPEVWRMVVIGALALGATVLIYRSPKLRYGLLGGLATLLILIGFVF